LMVAINRRISEIILIPDPNLTDTFELIPTMRIVDREEAVMRVRAIFPTIRTDEVVVERKLTIVHLPNGGVFALEESEGPSVPQ